MIKGNGQCVVIAVKKRINPHSLMHFNTNYFFGYMVIEVELRLPEQSAAVTN